MKRGQERPFFRIKIIRAPNVRQKMKDRELEVIV